MRFCKCSCVTSNAGKPDTAMEQKGRETTPHKLNNSLFIFQNCFSIPSFFSEVEKEAEGRWDIVWEDVGCVGATTSFIAPRCNNRESKAAGLRMCGKRA
jgi:hypothetical protein